MSVDDAGRADREPDFETIEAAVMETDRGRRFLAEFARRNRHGDTERLLHAIARLERSLVPPAAARSASDPDPEIAGLKRAICEMADAIAAAKREIAAIRPGDGEQGDIADATAELDAIVTATESATSDILEAAEQIQEIAWTLREAGVDAGFCDALDLRATEIYTACSFQDITGQRTTKVVRLLQTLETRLTTMAELWSGGIDGTAGTPRHGETTLLNGPPRGGEGVSQDDIDQMMDDVIPAAEPDPSLAQDDAATAGATLAALHEVADEDEPAADDRDPLAALSAKDYEVLFG